MGIGYQREIDNNPQSQTSPLFRYFMQTFEKEDIVLTSDANIEDVDINVSSGHGISVGDCLILYTDNYFAQEIVVGVSLNVITLDAPLAFIFSVADTIIIRGSRNLNVNGSVTPVDFKFKIFSKNSPPVDISVALFILSHSGVSDDGKFGDLASLTNGLLVRKENTKIFNLGVYKNNQDFRYVHADIEYSQKAPAGIYGTNIDIELERLGSFGQVVRMSYKQGDQLIARVRDNLSTLASFRISLIGSYTKGEI